MRNMVSVSVGLALAAAVAIMALAVGGAVVAGSYALEASASRHARGDPASEIPSEVRDALANREPGEGIGDAISDIASHRPRR
ncbi:MAG: hypothetical protein ACT4OI_10060 [Methanobacteriota archaeon]